MPLELTVAFVAAILAYLGFILTKEQKVSEFRQKWIDELRNDVADLISRSLAFRTRMSACGEGKSPLKVFPDYVKENPDELHAILSVAERAKFRLNPERDNTLINLIDELANRVTSPDRLKYEELRKLVDKVGKEAHSVFKTEWERVKEGEPWFRWSKWIAAAVLVLFALYWIFRLLLTCAA